MSKIKLIMVVLAISITSVFAELKIYEGFDYAVTNYPGSATGAIGSLLSLNGGLGWAEDSVWTRSSIQDTYGIVSDSLDFAGVVTSGNQLSALYYKGVLTRSVEPFSATTSDVLWGGVMFKLTSVKAGRKAAFYLRNSSYVNQFYIYAAADSTIKVAGGSSAEIDTGIVPGTSVRFVIYKLDYTQTTPIASVWINPSDFSSEVALGTPVAQVSGIGGSFASVKLLPTGNANYYDEIRLGTEFEDAWETLPPVIPMGTVLIIQ